MKTENTDSGSLGIETRLSSFFYYVFLRINQSHVNKILTPVFRNKYIMILRVSFTAREYIYISKSKI